MDDEIERVRNLAQTALNAHPEFIEMGVTEVGNFLLVRRTSSLAVIFEPWRNAQGWRTAFAEKAFVNLVFEAREPGKFGRAVLIGRCDDTGFAIQEWHGSQEALKSFKRPVAPLPRQRFQRTQIELPGALVAQWTGSGFDAEDEISDCVRACVDQLHASLYFFNELEIDHIVYETRSSPTGAEALVARRDDVDKKQFLYPIYTPRQTGGST